MIRAYFRTCERSAVRSLQNKWAAAQCHQIVVRCFEAIRNHLNLINLNRHVTPPLKKCTDNGSPPPMSLPWLWDAGGPDSRAAARGLSPGAKDDKPWVHGLTTTRTILSVILSLIISSR